MSGGQTQHVCGWLSNNHFLYTIKPSFSKIFENFWLFLFRFILNQEYTHKGGHASTARSTAPVAFALLLLFFTICVCHQNSWFTSDFMPFVRTFRTDEGRFCPKHVLNTHLLLLARGALLHFSG